MDDNRYNIVPSVASSFKSFLFVMFLLIIYGVLVSYLVTDNLTDLKTFIHFLFDAESVSVHSACISNCAKHPSESFVPSPAHDDPVTPSHPVMDTVTLWQEQAYRWYNQWVLRMYSKGKTVHFKRTN